MPVRCLVDEPQDGIAPTYEKTSPPAKGGEVRVGGLRMEGWGFPCRDQWAPRVRFFKAKESFASRALRAYLHQVKSICIHYFRPCCDKIIDEFRLIVILGIDF